MTSRWSRTVPRLALALLLGACAGSGAPKAPEELAPKAPEKLPPKSYPMPVEDPYHEPARSRVEVSAEVRKLVPFIGARHTHFESEKQRDETYETWCGLVADVRSFDGREATKQGRLGQLGYLYAVGHNLGVTGSAALADETLAACLKEFPESPECHWSRVAFYSFLPLTETRAAAITDSLDALRAQPHNTQQERMLEHALIELRLRQQDIPTAKRLIDAYLARFPDDPRADELRAERARLEQRANGHLP